MMVRSGGSPLVRLLAQREYLMSLKSGVLLSLFSGVSFADLQRSARSTSDAMPKAGSPSAADVAYATRFAGPAQISTATPVTKMSAANDAARVSDAA